MSKGNTVIKAIAVVVLIIGLYYALVPHTIHVRYELDFGLPHSYHVIGGIILSIIAIVILMMKKPESNKPVSL